MDKICHVGCTTKQLVVLYELAFEERYNEGEGMCAQAPGRQRLMRSQRA